MMLAVQLLLIDMIEWMRDRARVPEAEKREGLSFGAGKAPQGEKTLPYHRRVRI